MVNSCFICGKEIIENESVLVKAKGIAAFIKSSKQRLDDKWKTLVNVENVKVHPDCRRNYTRPDSIKKYVNQQKEMMMTSPVKGKLRSTYVFNFKKNCLFCDKKCSIEDELKKSKERRDIIFNVCTLHFKHSVEDMAKMRNDEWGKTVLKRLESVICLVAEEAIYHKSCERKFCKTISSQEKKKRGRPQDEDALKAFSDVCEYIEVENECQFTLQFLYEKMNGTCDERTFKNKLIEKYGEDLIITTTHGKKAIVSFKDTSFKILTEAWYTSKKKK